MKKATDVKVAATLTAHHLFLTIDDWAGNPVNFCKPVAKLPNDKRALVKAAVSGNHIFSLDLIQHLILYKIRPSTRVFAQEFTHNLLRSLISPKFLKSKMPWRT